MKILLTGANGGIGSSLLHSFLSQGFEVVATYNLADPGNLGVHERLKWVKVDFRVQGSMQEFLRDLGNFDVLIHCAGWADSALIGSQENDSIEDQISINLTSGIQLVNKLAPKMIQGGFGRIVLFGSIVGRDGGVGLSTYSATKSGLVGFVKSATKEIPILSKKFGTQPNFTINIVAPGYTETSMTAAIPTKVRDFIVTRSSTGRFTDPQEITRAVNFLILPESNSICGTVIEVNGGSFL
jgi:NAD(P)-dependent dehydrogenase (short-subunit alcohol dehydrogenase family)